MRECLWKIADLPPGARVVFLGQKTQVVAKREKTIEQGHRLGASALFGIAIGQPEAAGQKSALARRKSVRPGAGSIAQNIPVDDKLPLDGTQSAPYPRILGR